MRSCLSISLQVGWSLMLDQSSFRNSSSFDNGSHCGSRSLQCIDFTTKSNKVANWCQLLTWQCFPVHWLTDRQLEPLMSNFHPASIGCFHLLNSIHLLKYLPRFCSLGGALHVEIEAHSYCCQASEEWIGHLWSHLCFFSLLSAMTKDLLLNFIYLCQCLPLVCPKRSFQSA